MDDKVQLQKTKLQQRKNKIAAEETKLKLKERKIRTRHLIELGGLVVKAELDYLPTNTLYGALLTLQEALIKDDNINTNWTKIGSNKFDIEQSEYIPVIIKFDQQPDKNIRDALRSHDLKWNKFRSEWYGNVYNLDQLKTEINDVKYDIEIIN